LVYGATGAIGSAAVQLLKYFGAYVTAVCNTKNLDLVKSLGADDVINYETQNFTHTRLRFHFVFDAVGKTSFSACKPRLTEKGVYISTELGKNGQNVFLAIVGSIFKGKKVLFPIPKINKQDLEFLSELMRLKKFKPVIDRIYKLEEIVEAYEYVESATKTGNVLLKIGE